MMQVCAYNLNALNVPLSLSMRTGELCSTEQKILCLLPSWVVPVGTGVQMVSWQWVTDCRRSLEMIKCTKKRAMIAWHVVKVGWSESN